MADEKRTRRRAGDNAYEPLRYSEAQLRKLERVLFRKLPANHQDNKLLSELRTIPPDERLQRVRRLVEQYLNTEIRGNVSALASDAEGLIESLVAGARLKRTALFGAAELTLLQSQTDGQQEAERLDAIADEICRLNAAVAAIPKHGLRVLRAYLDGWTDRLRAAYARHLAVLWAEDRPAKGKIDLLAAAMNVEPEKLERSVRAQVHVEMRNKQGAQRAAESVIGDLFNVDARTTQRRASRADGLPAWFFDEWLQSALLREELNDGSFVGLGGALPVVSN